MEKENRRDALHAPFPYFGGKSRAADLIWSRFGDDCRGYVEPFFGSGAVLLSVPRNGRTETVSDADGMVANFWRAVAKDPEAVAHHADWPVTEPDLHARHLWLVGQRESLTERMCADAEFYDAKAAGWWCWGACAWIGGGWCSGGGPWRVGASGLLEKSSAGQGINRNLPHLSSAGQGINRNLPHLGNAGQGINRKLPAVKDGDNCANRSEFILSWMRRLADRMRHVRVTCGDWERICGDLVLRAGGTPCAVMLDPPYGDEGGGRRSDLYAVDSKSVAGRVREWCKQRTDRKDLRIALCGYDGEHNDLEALGWECVAWKANGGYGSQADKQGAANAKRERIWFSPACIRSKKSDDLQFALLGGDQR